MRNIYEYVSMKVLEGYHVDAAILDISIRELFQGRLDPPARLHFLNKNGK